MNIEQEERNVILPVLPLRGLVSVSYTHLRAHET